MVMELCSIQPMRLQQALQIIQSDSSKKDLLPGNALSDSKLSSQCMIQYHQQQDCLNEIRHKLPVRRILPANHIITVITRNQFTPGKQQIWRHTKVSDKVR